MSSKKPQSPQEKRDEQQRRLAELRASKQKHGAPPNAKRLPGHGARSQKGR